MHRRLPRSRTRWPARRRAGFSYRGLLIALVVVLTVPAIGWSVLPRWSWSSRKGDGPMMHRVERGEFVHDITERGNVESASNVEIASKVKSTGTRDGTAILWIVPEGTYAKPGDKLVELDSSALEIQETQQEIVVHSSEATVIQAKNVYETAEIAKKEYLEGTFQEELLTLEILIEEATENLSRLQQYLEFSRTLAEKGYVTQLQLKADEAAVNKARNQLKLANEQRRILTEYKKKKMLKQLDAEIATSKAKLAAEEASYKLDQERFNEIQEQIKNCTIFAPEAGQVVYANREGHRGESDVVIEEGTMIRERQVIIRLPDPQRMQVKAKINEARISLVRKEMSATVRLDAFPDDELEGVVEEVKDYPAPGSWWSPNVKEYEASVRILDSSKIDLRPGMTAEVKIRVDQRENELQVPVQTIIEHGAKYYCVVPDGQGFRSHEVKVGPTNDQVVVIEEGLQEGQEVVHNAAAFREEIDLPELPPEFQRASARRRPGGEEETPERGGKRPDAGQILQTFDGNGNGQLEPEELDRVPGGMRSALAAADADGDGVVDRGELAIALARFRAEGRAGGGRPGAPPEGSNPGPGRERPNPPTPPTGPDAAGGRAGRGPAARPQGSRPGARP
jgi:HlyD family secretion protein